MSDNVATLEQPTTVAPSQEQQGNQSPTDVNPLIAASLWNLNPTEYKPVEAAPAPTTEQQPTVQSDAPAPTTEPASPSNDATAAAQQAAAPSDDEVLDQDAFYTREFGMNAADFKAKWEELNKPRQEEVKWIDESKEEEVLNYIQQKRQLERLEKMEVADANQAAEIIRANLQYKYKDLTSEQIDRLFDRQYAMPKKPTQALDQSDDDYAVVVSSWETQVKEKQADLIIDAKIAKPELLQYKSKIVQPEIIKNSPQQPQLDQKALEVAQAGRQSYLSEIEKGYQNFKGFSVTVNDGAVQIPVNYSISPEELTASKSMIENFNAEDFFEKRWFDDGNKPKVTQIQEDLYLLMNRDKIFNAIAKESAAKRYEAHLKTQNNINLSGVNKTFGPTSTTNNSTPADSQKALADAVWGI